MEVVVEAFLLLLPLETVTGNKQFHKHEHPRSEKQKENKNVQETINMDHKMFQVAEKLQRINYNMKNIKIPKIERHHPLLRGLSHGERCYMFSIISVYDPTPARRRLYHKHKLLCKKAL